MNHQAPETPPQVEVVEVGGVRTPLVGAPTYTDRVRFRLAMGLVVAIALISLVLIATVAGGLLAIADAKELALTAVALFGIVSPVIGFYFATSRGS